jgi:hypothetical protein
MCHNSETLSSHNEHSRKAAQNCHLAIVLVSRITTNGDRVEVLIADVRGEVQKRGARPQIAGAPCVYARGVLDTEAGTNYL